MCIMILGMNYVLVDDSKRVFQFSVPPAPHSFVTKTEVCSRNAGRSKACALVQILNIKSNVSVGNIYQQYLLYFIVMANCILGFCLLSTVVGNVNTA